jgi:hypothetical protein
MFFWVVMLCGLIHRYQCFRETYCLHLQAWRTLVSIYESTWHHNPEQQHHHRHENLKSQVKWLLWRMYQALSKSVGSNCDIIATRSFISFTCTTNVVKFPLHYFLHVCNEDVPVCRFHCHRHSLVMWSWSCTAPWNFDSSTLVSWTWWRLVDFGRGTGAALKVTQLATGTILLISSIR